MNKAYSVTYNSDLDSIVIAHTSWKKTRVHSVREFISGQPLYNPITDTYPIYVHAEVWSLIEASRVIS